MTGEFDGKQEPEGARSMSWEEYNFVVFTSDNEAKWLQQAIKEELARVVGEQDGVAIVMLQNGDIVGWNRNIK